MAGAKKIGELVGEIAAASREQAQGIEQVNKAVAEMDKVVQKNAASAEESASAAEEMNGQAEQMKGFVADLVSVVEGADGTGSPSPSSPPGRSPARDQGSAIDPPSREGMGKAVPGPMKKIRGKDRVKGKATEVKPEQLIPMGEANFKEF